MNLEINIKVPLGAAGVSVAQSTGSAQPAVQPTPEPAYAVPPDAFPPAFDPARALPWGEPQRQAPNEPNGDYGPPLAAAPPSLADMGVGVEPRPDLGPPSLQELGASVGIAPGNGGVPPGLEGLDLPGATLGALEPPPPPELQLEEQAALERHMPPLPDELMRQTGQTKPPSTRHRKE